MAARHEPNEILIERVYDAPLNAVWAAWTEPDQVAKWWGPRGFTLTTHSKELKVGGVWHYTMHGPDGTDYVNKTLYHEVVPRSKLVYDHGGNDERAPLFRVTALFSERDGKTHLSMCMAFKSPEAAAESRVFIKQAGGNSTWDRLGEYLEKHEHQRDVFIIHRSFAAPIDRLFALWTEPKHFAQWLPPTGFSMEWLRADIRPGGSGFFRMTNGADITMFGRTQYLQVQRPDRLVYTQQFCDAQERVSRHPLSPVWPETMLTTVTFTAEGDSETRVSVHWQPQGNITAEELAAFIAERPGMTQGWTGSFDKLDGLL